MIFLSSTTPSEWDGSAWLRRNAVRVVLIGIAAWGLAACEKQQRPAPPPPYVATTIAHFGSLIPASSISGLIAPYENVAIQSTLVEPATAVAVQEGDRVSKGEVLAQLDTADLQAQLASDLASANAASENTVHTVYAGNESIAQGSQGLNGAQGAVQQAQANLARDQRDLKRYQLLYGQGYVSQQTYQEQQATVRSDQGALQTAQSNLRIAAATVQANGATLSAPGLQSSSVQQSQAQEQVELAMAQSVRVSIAKATIVSPIDGIVVNRNLNPGEYPGARQLFTLQQISPIFAILRGSADQIAGIHNGTSAAIATTDAGKPTQRKGTVVGILDEIAPGSTQFQVKVLLQNPGHTLRPGMAVVGSVTLPAVQGVQIPTTAFTDDNHDALQIVQPASTVKTVKVVEIASGGGTSVVSGIGPGARVVTNGQSSLGDGEKVSYKP